MTRVLVTQLLEANTALLSLARREAPAISGKVFGYCEEAITAAREYLATEPSSERAELIARLFECLRIKTLTTREAAAIKDAADMLEADADLRTQLARRTVERDMAISMAISMLVADAQQANKPTGWDNGLSQDYCAEFGQWLASRPGARQQIKEMFEATDESKDLYTLALKADNWGQP